MQNVSVYDQERLPSLALVLLWYQVGGPQKRVSLKFNFLTPQTKHMLWVLKRIILMRWFF